MRIAPKYLGKALKNGFGQDGNGVAATMLMVPDGFVNRDMLVEIEKDAIIG